MTDPLFLSEENPRSRRSVILADEGSSVWLYLTEPGTSRPVADCWILNTIPAPEDLSGFSGGKGPPPATRAFAGPGAHGRVPAHRKVRFVWAEDGESVAVFIANDLVGFIARGQRRGFSKHLTADGPFGQPLDHALYKSLFA